MKQIFSLILGILFFQLVVSCSDETQPDYYPHANQFDSLAHDGLTRTYILHVPTTYNKDSEIPLVIVMHGYTATAQGMEEWTKFSEKADAENFIVVYPNGVAYPWTSSNPQAWNCGGQWEEWTRQTDDVGFIDDLIELICKNYSIDRNRIFITGHSNGSRMTYRLAHELSDKIAAIAPVSGSMVYSTEIAPASPVSILHLHALNDNTVLYYGQSNPSQTVYPAVDSVLSKWSAFYMCNNMPDTIQTEADYIVKSWNCESNKADLLLYVMQRGEHQWFTTQNSGIDATNLIWDFFKNHPKQTD